MTISEYQKHLDKILQTYKTPYWSPLSNMARLTEEVGEVARALNHMYGYKPKKEKRRKRLLGGRACGCIIYCRLYG
jgi:NTP pyrophosphatase (non-canonical NTP hydrolase)